jgi:23S rRNA (guanosine2251-2'-O)-methyltransferase
MGPKNSGSAGVSRFVTGYRAIEEYIRKNDGAAVLHAGARNRRILDITEKARAAGIPVRWTDEKTLAGLPVRTDHRGLALELQSAPQKIYTTFEEFLAARRDAGNQPPGPAGLVLVLDGITDVHNLGALLRSADLFSLDAVILPPRRSAKDSDVVAKISSGASAFVPLLEAPNLVRAIRDLKEAGFWIYGADMKGRPAPETKLEGSAALVLGSEGKGLSRLVRETCDALISIPTAGHIDSFNVSVAGGILLYEIRRQQGQLGEVKTEGRTREKQRL